LRNHFFGVANAVDGGGVDPIHAEFERAMNGVDGVCVLLVSPSKIPAAPADSPGAEPGGSDLQIGIAEFARFHIL
jgi:hypothetical protein